MENIQNYRHKVQYYETDAMAVVHHSNYIRWFEEARLDYMEQMLLPYNEIEKRGFMIPVLSASCKYRQAVRFGETVEIETKFTSFSGLKFAADYKIYDESHRILHATGSTQHCFLDKEFHPVRLKQQALDIYHIFEAVVNQGCEK